MTGVEIDVRADIKEATRYLNRVQKRAVPVATAKALTFTAQRAQKRITAIIPQVFSNPTNFVRRSVRFIPATLRKPVSTVHIPNQAMERVLLVQSDMRQTSLRPKKRNEIKLLGSYWVIGDKAKTNKFGNLPVATYRRMLSDIAARAGGRKDFFIIGHKPRRMIMKRRLVRTAAVPWLVEVQSTPRYSRRLPMNRITQTMVKQQFRRLFDKAMAREVARVSARV